MKKTILTSTIIALTLAACGQQSASTEQDKQIAENQKQIELLRQQAEIQRLQNELQATAASATAAAEQVYQLATSEVANTIPQAAQMAAKAGEVVQGTDGQQYLYDADSGNWLLYGAIGAAAGYLMSNAMNNRNAAKYTPVGKPTAAVQRVHQDYRAKNPAAIPSPRAQIQPNAPVNRPTTQSAPAYRSTNQGYSNTRKFGFGGRKRR
ncbi:hypothetical protein QG053_04090 [Kingella kingae]|uniref:hypothetical protein n=1 Tax=Kingella kingae TaxID=504 RepID=UPI002551233B|nr:hypothetical protein [Kingella kingae]MDK4564238.1 hypothetical protein [Kingella kingae]